MRSHFGLRRCGLLAATLLTAGCAPIRPGPELQQVSQDVGHATGATPQWAEHFEPRPLTPDADGLVRLDQVINLSLANNRGLRADLETIGQAKADLVQAGLLPNPVLSLMFRFPEAGGRAGFDFGLMQELSDLWLIPSRKQAAQAMLRQKLLGFTDAAIALVADAKSGYHRLQYQALALELQQQNLEILRQALEVAQIRLRAGESTLLDVNLLRSRQQETELMLVELRSDYRMTQRVLLRLMGVARAPDDWQPEPLPLDTPPASLPGDEDAYVDAALEQRLDAKAAWWEVQSAAAEMREEKLKFIQGFGVGVSGERTEQQAQPGRNVLADTVRESLAAGRLMAPEIEPRSMRRAERRAMLDFMIGPSLSVALPVFDQNQARVAKARYRALELRQRYEALEQEVIEGVRTALTERRLAETRTQFYRGSLLPIQESNLQLAQAAYQAGKEPVLTVLLAQEELIRTRLAFAKAVGDLAISTVKLERQLAGRIPDVTTEPPPPISAPAAPE